MTHGSWLWCREGSIKKVLFLHASAFTSGLPASPHEYRPVHNTWSVAAKAIYSQPVLQLQPPLDVSRPRPLKAPRVVPMHGGPEKHAVQLKYLEPRAPLPF